jgi:hypothetical protein
VQVRPQLVGSSNPVTDQVLARPAHLPQRDSGFAVADQRHQPSPVGPKRVSEHERVESVIFVARRAVTAAEILDLVWADHHNRDLGLQQGLHYRPIRPLDRHLLNPVLVQQAGQITQTGGVMRHGAAGDFLATIVDHRHRMVLTSPIQPGGDTVDRLVGQTAAGRLHVSLLAASPSGEAPVTGARTLAGSLTDRRSKAHSPVDGHTSWVTARSRRSRSGHQLCQVRKAVTRRHHRCIDNPSEIADATMVHQ